MVLEYWHLHMGKMAQLCRYSSTMVRIWVWFSYAFPMGFSHGFGFRSPHLLSIASPRALRLKQPGRLASQVYGVEDGDDFAALKVQGGVPSKTAR